MKINAEKTINGIVLSAIIEDRYIHKLYIGYTLKTAKSLFRKYIKELAK